MIPEEAVCDETASSIAESSYIGERYASAAYSSSATGSSHSFDAPSAGTAMATCENQLSDAAPCQCFVSGGMLTASPGLSSRAGRPHSW